MIRIGQKYINPAAVDTIEESVTDPDNWSNVFLRGQWLTVNAPAAVVADRIREALT